MLSGTCRRFEHSMLIEFKLSFLFLLWEMMSMLPDKHNAHLINDLTYILTSILIWFENEIWHLKPWKEYYRWASVRAIVKSLTSLTEKISGLEIINYLHLLSLYVYEYDRLSLITPTCVNAQRKKNLKQMLITL